MTRRYNGYQQWAFSWTGHSKLKMTYVIEEEVLGFKCQLWVEGFDYVECVDRTKKGAKKKAAEMFFNRMVEKQIIKREDVTISEQEVNIRVRAAIQAYGRIPNAPVADDGTGDMRTAPAAEEEAGAVPLGDRSGSDAKIKKEEEEEVPCLTMQAEDGTENSVEPVDEKPCVSNIGIKCETTSLHSEEDTKPDVEELVELCTVPVKKEVTDAITEAEPRTYCANCKCANYKIKKEAMHVKRDIQQVYDNDDDVQVLYVVSSSKRDLKKRGREVYVNEDPCETPTKKHKDY